MAAYREEAQEIVFPDDWEVVHYEKTNHALQVMQNWRFKLRTQKARAGVAEVWTANALTHAVIDFIAWVPGKAELLLIEVKDYRRVTNGGDPVPAQLADWVAWKARDALAGLAVAALRPGSDVHDFARRALTASQVRVFVDVKWPPSGPDVAQRRLRQQLQLQQCLGPLATGSAVVDATVKVPWITKDVGP